MYKAVPQRRSLDLRSSEFPNPRVQELDIKISMSISEEITLKQKVVTVVLRHEKSE